MRVGNGVARRGQSAATMYLWARLEVMFAFVSLLLGLASGASALAIGSTGARSIPKVAAADGPSAKTVQSAELSRILPFEGIAIGCSVVAILLIFVG